MVCLGCADQKGQAASGGKEPGCDREDGFEAFDCPQCDYVEGTVRERFGAGVLYIDVRQYKCSDDLAEEGGLLVVRFDQGQGDLGRPEFDGEAGESGAGTNVGNSDSRRG